MVPSMLPIEANVYVQVINIYARDRAVHLGKKLHAQLIINGFARFTVIASKLIALYTECGTLSFARKLFKKIPATRVRRWIALIGTCARCGFHKEALSVFSEMQTEWLKLNVFVMPSALKACGHLCDLKTGEKMHGLILKCSLHENLAEVAIKYLLVLETESAGNRLLLSSLYADAGEWGMKG